MAENEYLDSTKARHWQSVATGIRDGCNADELTARTKEQFFRTLKKIESDFPLANLIGAIDDLPRMTSILDGIDGGEDVKDHFLEAAKSGLQSEQALQSMLESALQNCLYDIPYLASELSEKVNITEARRSTDEILRRLRPVIIWVAKKLTENPNWKPRMPAQRTSAGSENDRTKRMLDESLIAGFRK